MQPLAAGAKLTAYHQRLQSSHDFQVQVDVLSLDEVVVGTATLLDGQVDIQEDGPVRRTASLTVSDPNGALDFSNGSAWSGTHLWVDRLVRVTHVLDVPGYGEVRAVPFIGVPTAISRSGAEVQVSLSDKAALGLTGARPYTAAKGANAASAIRSILTYCTGEFRYRFPAYTRRLSKAYAVGWSADASPVTVASQIARVELGMQLLWSCDGYATLRPLPSAPVADVGYVTDQANSQADFSTLGNYAVVTGGATSKKVGANTVTTRPISTAVAASSSSVSPTRLQRQGVPRYLPIVVDEDGYKTTTQTAARAAAEVSNASRQADDLSTSVVPMFHLDADDVLTIHYGESSRTVRFHTGSIPLGVGGDMTVGFRAWVSAPAAPRVSSHVARSVKKNPVKKAAAAPKGHHHTKHHAKGKKK